MICDTLIWSHTCYKYICREYYFIQIDRESVPHEHVYFQENIKIINKYVFKKQW